MVSAETMIFRCHPAPKCTRSKRSMRSTSLCRELLSETFRSWCEENEVEIRYIQPGKPNQNAFIERFNRTFRGEVLSAYLFEDLDQVRQIAWEWMIEYNEERPHDALGKIPPKAFRKKVEAGNSSYELSA